MAAKSLRTLKPLTSNQPWRPNGVLYGRHWANAACTRASHPSPAFYIPSVPAAIWLTPHQHPRSPTHISLHNRHAYARAHTLSRALGASIGSDKGLIDSFVMSLKHHPQTPGLSHLSRSHVIDFWPTELWTSRKGGSQGSISLPFSRPPRAAALTSMEISDNAKAYAASISLNRAHCAWSEGGKLKPG